MKSGTAGSVGQPLDDDQTDLEYAAKYGFDRNHRPYSAAQTRARLADLAEFCGQARQIVARGREQFLADTFQSQLLRNSAAYLIIEIATVAEKLHSTYKETKGSVDWRALRSMRNLVAHRYDDVDQVVVWDTLVGAIPKMSHDLGLPHDLAGVIIVPDDLLAEPDGQWGPGLTD